jgi:hypothetical protein
MAERERLVGRRRRSANNNNNDNQEQPPPPPLNNDNIQPNVNVNVVEQQQQG